MGAGGPVVGGDLRHADLDVPGRLAGGRGQQEVGVGLGELFGAPGERRPPHVGASGDEREDLGVRVRRRHVVPLGVGRHPGVEERLAGAEHHVGTDPQPDLGVGVGRQLALRDAVPDIAGGRLERVDLHRGGGGLEPLRETLQLVDAQLGLRVGEQGDRHLLAAVLLDDPLAGRLADGEARVVVRDLDGGRDAVPGDGVADHGDARGRGVGGDRRHGGRIDGEPADRLHVAAGDPGLPVVDLCLHVERGVVGEELVAGLLDDRLHQLELRSPDRDVLRREAPGDRSLRVAGFPALAAVVGGAADGGQSDQGSGRERRRASPSLHVLCSSREPLVGRWAASSCGRLDLVCRRPQRDGGSSRHPVPPRMARSTVGADPRVVSQRTCPPWQGVFRMDDGEARLAAVAADREKSRDRGRGIVYDCVEVPTGALKRRRSPHEREP